MKQKLMNLIPKSYKIIPASGFTLIEMIVVIAIVGLLSTVTLTNYRDVSERISLENLAQQIAIVIRQAQVYGIGVVNAHPSYGVYFPNSANSFVLFVDRDNDGRYSGESEDVERITLKNNNTISALSANKISSSCSDVKNLSTVDVVFTRPNPDANFYVMVEESRFYPADVEITIRSANGGYREVSIWLTGQISIGDRLCS